MKLIGFVCPRLHNYVVEENKCVRKLDTNDPLWHTVIWHSFCICLNSISCFYHCPILLSVRTQFRTIIVDNLALMDKIQLLYVSIVSMSERKFIKICFVTVCYRVYIVFTSLTLQSVTKTFSWHLDLQFYYCCCWRCCCDSDVLDDNEHYLYNLRLSLSDRWLWNGWCMLDMVCCIRHTVYTIGDRQSRNRRQLSIYL